MRVKFEISSDDQIQNVNSDYDGTEYISVVRSGDRLIVTVNVIDEAEPSIKENEINLKKDFLEKAKKKPIYKNFLEIFPDGELIDIETVEKNND